MNLECILCGTIPLKVYSPRARELLGVLLNGCHFDKSFLHVASGPQAGMKLYAPTGVMFKVNYVGPYLHVAADGECQLGYYSYHYYSPFKRAVSSCPFSFTDEKAYEDFMKSLSLWCSRLLDEMNSNGVGIDSELHFPGRQDVTFTLGDMHGLRMALRGAQNSFTGQPCNLIDAEANRVVERSVKAKVDELTDMWIAAREAARPRESELGVSFRELTDGVELRRKLYGRMQEFLRSTGKFKEEEIEDFIVKQAQQWW